MTGLVAPRRRAAARGFSPAKFAEYTSCVGSCRYGLVCGVHISYGNAALGDTFSTVRQLLGGSVEAPLYALVTGRCHLWTTAQRSSSRRILPRRLRRSPRERLPHIGQSEQWASVCPPAGRCWSCWPFRRSSRSG